jgi:hypothetical protein
VLPLQEKDFGNLASSVAWAFHIDSKNADASGARKGHFQGTRAPGQQPGARMAACPVSALTRFRPTCLTPPAPAQGLFQT